MSRKTKASYVVPLLVFFALAPSSNIKGAPQGKSKPKQVAPQRKVKVGRWVRVGSLNALDPYPSEQWVWVEQWVDARTAKMRRVEPKPPPYWKSFRFNGRKYYHVPL
jgi:hypothetical protein